VRSTPRDERLDSLVILHTNDVHARLMPFTREDSALVGGAAARAALIARERSRGGSTLLLDAGDVFQGTPLFNFFRGVPDYRSMSEMRYDAGALGNHDLDDGPAWWLTARREASFPILCANVFVAAESAWAQAADEPPVEDRRGARWIGGNRVPDETRLRYLTRPFLIVTLDSGLRVGLFGLITPELTHIVEVTRNGGVAVGNPLDAARRLVPQLRREADLVICLSHMGVADDRKLAERVPGIDVIIGGHSHTRIDPPILVRNGTQNGMGGTVIGQTGSRGEQLGRIAIYLDGRRAVAYAGRLIPVRPSDGEDSRVAALLQPFADSIRSAMGKPVFHARSGIPSFGLRQGETPLGNFVADVLRETAGADLALINSGGIRAPIPAGEVTVGDLWTVLPFDDRIVKVTMPGWLVRQLFDFGARRIGQGGFPQVSGISFVIRGDRASEIEIDGKPLDSDRLYRVATNDFLYHGGDGYTIFAKAPEAEDTGVLLREAAVEFLTRHPDYPFRKESRIRWEGSTQGLRDLQGR
jgi:2',3'-cyclic-nucleotide 2'-phosphodiesterase (5'-nucleotidase family)